MQQAQSRDRFVAPAGYDAGVDQPESLTAEQERILAEIVQSQHSAGSGLRYAVVPLDVLADLPVHTVLASVSARSQNYLTRAAREWARRGGDADGLACALVAARRELSGEKPESTAVDAGSRGGEKCAGLLADCLSLDRTLIGPARQGDAAQQFIAELDRALARIDRCYPASALEQLDVRRAQALARAYFIRAQMPLAMMRACVVRRHSRLPLEDLIQIGNVALMQAVDKFDPHFGAPFAAYAYPWIKQAILRGERQADIVPLAQRLSAMRGKVRAAAAAVALGGDVSSAGLIGKRLGISERVVAQILRAEAPVLSLDGVDGRSLAQTCADERAPALDEHVRIRERRLAVQAALATCPQRERSILCRLFGIGCPAEPASEIARSLHVSSQRVYQIKTAEIRRLRRPSIVATLRDFA